jgi:hypothetical protein
VFHEALRPDRAVSCRLLNEIPWTVGADQQLISVPLGTITTLAASLYNAAV